MRAYINIQGTERKVTSLNWDQEGKVFAITARDECSFIHATSENGFLNKDSAVIQEFLIPNLHERVYWKED